MRINRFILVLAFVCIRALSYAQWQPNGIPVCDTTANSGFYTLPQIVSDGNGGAFVCWRDARRGEFDIYMQRIYPDGSKQFQHNGIALCDAPYSQQFPRMVSDGRGGAYVAWEDDRTSTNTHIYVQHLDSNGNALWQLNGVRASERSGLFISIANNASSGVLLGWISGGIYDVFVQRLDSLGNRMWGDSGLQVTNRPETVSAGGVAVTTDGAGGLIVVWVEGNRIYVQRVDSSGAVRWPTNGILISNPAETSGSVAISPDLTGGAIVSWSGGLGGFGDTTYHYAQRLSASGNLLWGTNPVRLGPIGAGGIKRNTPDGRGGAFIGFGRWIQHVDSSGSLLWPGYGTPFTTAQTSLSNSSQVTDRTRGVWNFWAQGGASFDIYGQYIDIAGTARWGSNGSGICTNLAHQDIPRAASDGNGYAILVWDDFRNGHSNVYATKADTSGVVTSVPEDHGSLLPTFPTLKQNYPNPFNPETTILFSVPRTTFVTLKVYDVLGRHVQTIVQEVLAAGLHEVRFRADAVSGGIYFYRLTSEQTTIVKKMVLMH